MTSSSGEIKHYRWDQIKPVIEERCLFGMRKHTLRTEHIQKERVGDDPVFLENYLFVSP